MKKFLTENGDCEGPDIEALDFGHAELLAEKLGVKVYGEHFLTISGKNLTDEAANKICKAFSESIGIE